MSKGAAPFSHGIYVVTGKPGHGKSYGMTLWMLKEALKGERPIWTNVPIDIKTCRAWLYLHAQGSQKRRRRIAHLIREMTQDHFTRMASRLHSINERSRRIMEGIEGVKDLSQRGKFTQEKAWKQATEEIDNEDPPVFEGAGANSIMPGAVLFLDELHQWYPSRDYRNEPKEILSFTSMHRHGMWKIFVSSQRRMNVSLSFRAMCQTYIHVINLSKWRLLPGIGGLPITVFGYWYFDNSDIDESNGKLIPGGRPMHSDFEMPVLRKNWIYRCYRSYSHAGSIKELHAARARTVGLMLDEEDSC